LSSTRRAAISKSTREGSSSAFIFACSRRVEDNAPYLPPWNKMLAEKVLREIRGAVFLTAWERKAAM
jgi:hypothetical protein